MKIPSATLLLLSSSVGIVRGVLPPGYEDNAYCQPGACLLYTNVHPGPRSSFTKCHDETTGKTTEAVWTGSKSDIKPPNGWTKNPEKCQDDDKKNEMDPANQQKFADELTASLYSKPNECTSSLSVSMVFSLLYPGATNDGITAMRDTFGYPDGKTSDRMLESANGECLMSGYDGTCVYDAPLLKLANSVWLDKSDTLKEDYEEVVGQYAMQADFKAANSSTLVNEWVNQSTNGLIDSIVAPGPLYGLLAINSIYLKAKWSDPMLFHAQDTNLDTFYASPSRSKKVSEAHFMHTEGLFDYSHGALKGYQTISIHLGESSMSMLFVLPIADGAAGPVKSTDLIGALDKLESRRRVALALPKFNFESKYEDDLKEALVALGLESLFTGTESLCGLQNSSCLSISSVIQKTSISVDEKGVEAAATTAVTMVGSSLLKSDPILMMLDHPFQFFIYDEKEELMLFEGRLGSPKVPEKEPSTPLLDAKHSDSDFWQAHFSVNPVNPPSPDDVMTSVLRSWWRESWNQVNKI